MVLKRPGEKPDQSSATSSSSGLHHDHPTATKRVRLQGDEPTQTVGSAEPAPAAAPTSMGSMSSGPTVATTATTASGSRREFQGQSKTGGLHSIDSDDEEEYAQSKRIELMADDDIEGEEAGTIERDGHIQITPFNLKDEQEEGSFAKDGSFVWNKKKDDEASDRWLEGIDWGKVQERSQAEKAKKEAEDDREDEAEANYDELTAYRAILSLLQPRESVAQAIRRYAGGKKTSAQRLQAKRRIKAGQESPEEKRDRLAMEKLTGLADSILTRSGYMEIYEQTFESITYKLKQTEGSSIASKTEIPADVDDDEALDMFMDSAKDREESTEKSTTQASSENPLESEVKWEFKWENEASAKVHGPHTTQEMIDWQASGFFDKGVFVRKNGTQGDFNDVKRIDFELYT